MHRLLATALFAASMFSPAAAAEPSGQTVSGIRCERDEGSAFHIHQHLAIFDHGRAVMVPSDVGRPLVGQCLYWIHTHTSDGIIHVEAPVVRTFTLGEFFDVWGEPLTRARVASAHAARGATRVYVNGAPYAGDPRKIELVQHADIVIEVGPPYAAPVPFTDWAGQ